MSPQRPCAIQWNSYSPAYAAQNKFCFPRMVFQWLWVFSTPPRREAYFLIYWKSQFWHAQNPSEKQCFISYHKSNEIWCAQNASQRSLYCMFVVPAEGFLKKQESALPRVVPLTFFSCCRPRASTHCWFFQHLPSENRFSHRLISKSVIGVQVFHLGPPMCHHHFCLFNSEWESL